MKHKEIMNVLVGFPGKGGFRNRVKQKQNLQARSID